MSKSGLTSRASLSRTFVLLATSRRIAPREAFMLAPPIPAHRMLAMSVLSRRSFIAASAAVAAGPSLGATTSSGEVDIAIIGAGAAGIAAARKIAAAGVRPSLSNDANQLFAEFEKASSSSNDAKRF